MKKHQLAIAMAGATMALSPHVATAVRVNADGHGQALVYPLYTARAIQSGNNTVTALALTNTGASAKAVKVRILEGKSGTEVLDFNLFLSQYDVWTAGIIAAGAGAGIFTQDQSCTTPRISNSSAQPTLFRNNAYIGDTSGDSLDRTYEGYIEILEMGSIASNSTLETAVTHKTDLSAPNASKPNCSGLPLTNTQPSSLQKPTGGLMGRASFINVNDGTDLNADAVAFGQWSDKVQWSAAGNAHPNLSDASPAVSTVVDARADGDGMIVSKWSNGRDAVSAVLMANRLRNDFTVEPAIAAATDWIVTMPTKRYYMNGLSAAPPFETQTTSSTSGQTFMPIFYDREEQSPGDVISNCWMCFSPPPALPHSTTTVTWTVYGAALSRGHVLGSRNMAVGLSYYLTLFPNYINGWGELILDRLVSSALAAPVGQSTFTDTLTGVTTSSVNATYRGLPVIGFSAQSYSTNGLPGVNPNVLSNYGGSFAHKVTRRIDISK